MAKMPPGILNANINWLGNWQLCNSVFNNKTTPPIKAKYCRAEILSNQIDALAVIKRLYSLNKKSFNKDQIKISPKKYKNPHKNDKKKP